MKFTKLINDELIEIREYAKPNACFQTNEYSDSYDFCILKEQFNPFDLFYNNKKKDKQIERLNNENHNLYSFIYEFIGRLEHIRDNGSKTYIKENLDLVIKYMNEKFKEYYKLKQLKESGNNE